MVCRTQLLVDDFPIPLLVVGRIVLCRVRPMEGALRAELDAYYARLYGLTEEELSYILDPADVYGPDFPGETFRVLKEKEIKQYGEYCTRRLVLEAWARLS